MNCADVEILICDYVDGTLAPPARAEVERHLAECQSCAELARDATEAVQFIQRAADVEPPQELISHILFDPPWHKQRSSRFATGFHALLQPRFAMGMALTVLSIAMIMPKMRNFQPADLSPAAVWAGIEGRADRLWARSQKYYDNLKLIYQIRATLRDWQLRAQETSEPGGSGSQVEKQTDRRRVPVKTPPQEERAPVPAGKP
jgi:Putative zinc-finger